MKRIISTTFLAFLLLGTSAAFAENGSGKDKEPKSARGICHRKCEEELDRCVDKGKMSRIKCGKETEECHANCNKMLK